MHGLQRITSSHSPVNLPLPPYRTAQFISPGPIAAASPSTHIKDIGVASALPCLPVGAEQDKAVGVHVDAQRIVAGDEHPHPDAELAPLDEQRVRNVPLRLHVRLFTLAESPGWGEARGKARRKLDPGGGFSCPPSNPSPFYAPCAHPPVIARPPWRTFLLPAPCCPVGQTP